MPPIKNWRLVKEGKDDIVWISRKMTRLVLFKRFGDWFLSVENKLGTSADILPVKNKEIGKKNAIMFMKKHPRS